MPKLTVNYRESQRYFIQQTVIPLVEENRRLPRQIRKSDTKMIIEISYRFGHSVKQIYRLLDLYGKKSIQPPHVEMQVGLFAT